MENSQVLNRGTLMIYGIGTKEMYRFIVRLNISKTKEKVYVKVGDQITKTTSKMICFRSI